LYSIINIIGLAVSVTVCILIALWVKDELSFDKFHENEKNIYLVGTKQTDDIYWATTPAPMSIFAKAEMPEIKDYCRIAWYDNSYVEYNNKKFYGNDFGAVDSSFFRIFDFQLLEGNIQELFKDAQSIIISETKAKAIFGEEDPMGKLIRLSNDISFQVTGIMKDMPKNSSIRYDMLVPFEVLNKTYGGNGFWKRIDDDWGNYSYRTCLLLQPNADHQSVSSKLGEMVTRLRQEQGSGMRMTFRFSLQPLAKLHLYSLDGKPAGLEKVYLFSIIAVLIILIACINYVNLVTARSSKRGKEIAIRKISGAKLPGLFRQLMEETALLLFASLAITIALVYLLLPFYNELSGKEMSFNIFDPSSLLIFGATTLCVLCLTGIYPAILLGSFKPMEAFGRSSTGKNKHIYFRKALVVLQFTCSIILILGTIVIGKQLDYLQKKNLGYSKENIITVPQMKMQGHYDAVRDELLKNKNVSGVSVFSFDNMTVGSSRMGVSWPGKDENNDLVFHCAWSRFEMPELMNIPIVEGKLPPGTPGENYVMLNEEAVKQMKLENPVGAKISLNSDNNYVEVTGILKDFNFAKLNENIKPLIISFTDNSWGYLYVKTTGEGTQSVIASLEKLWKQYNPDYEFNYNFMDDFFEKTYRTDIQTERLLSVFSIVAIFISCLGLFGLVTYTAETKTKEIGIRKVLGASVSNIVNMLSKEFLILVGIAMLIAFPLAYFWLDKMLQDYAYRISITWPVFALAGMITLALTLLTVSWQAIKAATANPVKSIKTE
jgi:ABC-type antimicrobial peptide transport system permease subunit